MAFIVTGVFLASLINSGKIGIAEVSLSLSAGGRNKTKSGMIFMVIGIILLIGTVSSAYLLLSKIFGAEQLRPSFEVLFEKSGDIDKTGKKLTKAAGLDKQDEYYQGVSRNWAWFP